MKGMAATRVWGGRKHKRCNQYSANRPENTGIAYKVKVKIKETRWCERGSGRLNSKLFDAVEIFSSSDSSPQ